jgi:hypothetical protein
MECPVATRIALPLIGHISTPSALNSQTEIQTAKLSTRLTKHQTDELELSFISNNYPKTEKKQTHSHELGLKLHTVSVSIPTSNSAHLLILK